MEALDSLIASIPDWHVLLDDLNSTIATRQQELAQLDDYQPPTRSLKNKGSTESLRPKDVSESPIHEENEMQIPTQASSEPPLTFTQASDLPTISIPGSPTVLSPTKPTVAPPLLSHASSPGPATLQRRTSNRLANAFKPSPSSPPIARKRKTASVASNDSRAPKYRTRSMIIVYYDSAVQIAFEELVKFISASRNAMRKGKMAARMADMRRMADLEMGSSDEEDTKDASPPTLDKRLPTYMTANGNSHAIAVRKELKDAVDGDGDSDMELPKLQFISTRRMGPSRDQVAVQKQAAAPPGGATALPPIHGMLRSTGNWRTNGLGSAQSSGSASIFDELDTGLEWSQSMCERAAHQFLRDGDCNIEIEGIKRRLNEVKETAEKQLVSNATEEAKKALAKAEGKRNSLTKTPERPRGEMYAGSPAQPNGRRSLKAIQMRRTPTMGLSPEVKVPSAMEVDDEGFGDDDEEELPKLVWRSARDI